MYYENTMRKLQIDLSRAYIRLIIDKHINIKCSQTNCPVLAFAKHDVFKRLFRQWFYLHEQLYTDYNM